MPNELPQILLRIEAVNLRQFIYDTNNLSVIRGGCVLLLDWPRLFLPGTATSFPWNDFEAEPTSISQGASALLLRVQFNGADRREELRAKIDSYLSAPARQETCHATYVVDYVACSQNFASDVRTVIAKNRLRQLRRLNVAVPPNPTASERVPCSPHRYCQIDGTRPAVQKATNVKDPGIHWISASVAYRLSVGREEKATWERILRRAEEHEPPARQTEFHSTWDFQELTARGEHIPARITPDPLAHLAGKMAILYIDGNQFGKHVAQAEQSGVEALQAWDRFLRARRQGLVDALRQEMEHAEWQVRSEGQTKQRIETLLWGGDEQIWVVPAWQGLKALQWFFQHTGTWQWQGQALTHAAGLVLCSHKAPIRDGVALAYRLAELAKEHRGRQQENAFAYQVLESFDHLGDDFASVRAERRPPGVSAAEMVLPANALDQLFAWKATCQNKNFPSRRLHMITRSLFTSDQRYQAVLERGRELLEERSGHIAADDPLVPPGVQPQTSWLLEQVRTVAESCGGSAGGLAAGPTEPEEQEMTEQNIKIEDCRQQLQRLLPSQPWTSERAAWLHLSELWDYLIDPRHVEED